MRWSGLLILLLCAACGDGTESADARRGGPGGIPVLEAGPLAAGQRIRTDGMAAEEGWRFAKELTVPLEGPGSPSVTIKAVHDGARLYMLLYWPDPRASLNRYWKYVDHLEWEKYEREDGLSICWSPGAESARFREQGCAMFCHDGRHVYPGDGSRYVDFWYFGAQQTRYHAQARDMFMAQGEMHRLRGDNQPANSDNALNLSTEYTGPRYLPTFRTKNDDRVLFGKGLKEVSPDWIKQYWTDPANIGREVPIDILRPRGGSRGDVLHGSRFHKGKGWFVELARDFRTGNRDDLPFGDPLVPVYFAVAVNDDAVGPNHAMSAPIELRFLSTRG